MSRQTYRNELKIISEILESVTESGSNGRYITEIVRDANLSYSMALEKLKKLVDGGLVKTAQGEKSRVYVATEQGIKFYRELGNFEELTSCLRVT
ncbi:MAG: hypothetical protein KGH87_04590 [Thaumarchaeota archaeon]|nr:hypothetical protein [Nitrososphaerota archaeon]MDE1839181.1 hypothetical protein [Nitrososphaerota archaeon]